MISKRMIELKLREKIPERTHIRDGAVDRIQEVIGLKIDAFLNQIVDNAALKDSMVITKDVVNESYVDMEILSLTANDTKVIQFKENSRVGDSI
jgi:hypothetical protein